MTHKKSVHGHDTTKHRLPKNYCFGCGPDNPEGLRMKFQFDEANHRVSCKFRVPKKYWARPSTHTAASLLPSSTKVWAR